MRKWQLKNSYEDKSTPGRIWKQTRELGRVAHPVEVLALVSPSLDGVKDSPSWYQEDNLYAFLKSYSQFVVQSFSTSSSTRLKRLRLRQTQSSLHFLLPRVAFPTKERPLWYTTKERPLWYTTKSRSYLLVVNVDFRNLSLKCLWEASVVVCNAAQPNSRRREVGWAGVYWCALGPHARMFRWGLDCHVTAVSSPAACFTTNSLLGLWESAVAQVLNRQRVATQRRWYVQAVVVYTFTSIYACGSRIRAGCSRHSSRYSTRLRLQTAYQPARGAWRSGAVPCVPSWSNSVYVPRSLAWSSAGAPYCWCQQAESRCHLHLFRSCVVEPLRVFQGLSASYSLATGTSATHALERRHTGRSLHVTGRYTCVLWTASNIKLVWHDGHVRQETGVRQVVRADPLCVRQEDLTRCRRLVYRQRKWHGPRYTWVAMSRWYSRTDIHIYLYLLYPLTNYTHEICVWIRTLKLLTARLTPVHMNVFIHVFVYIQLHDYVYVYKWDTLSEATVTFRTVVTFVTWLISRTEFLV